MDRKASVSMRNHFHPLSMQIARNCHGELDWAKRCIPGALDSQNYDEDGCLLTYYSPSNVNFCQTILMDGRMIEKVSNEQGRGEDSWAPGQYETLLARHINFFQLSHHIWPL